MNAARLYRKTQATTATREEVLLMLYDGALRFNEEAADAFRAGDTSRAGERVGRVLAILAELQAALDFSVAPDLCRTLDALYTYMTDRLLEANRDRSVARVEEVSGLLGNLRETWAQAADVVRREQANASGMMPQVAGATGYRAQA